MVLTLSAGKPGSKTGFPLLPQFHTLAGVTGGYLQYTFPYIIAGVTGGYLQYTVPYIIAGVTGVYLQCTVPCIIAGVTWGYLQYTVPYICRSNCRGIYKIYSSINY